MEALQQKFPQATKLKKFFEEKNQHYKPLLQVVLNTPNGEITPGLVISTIRLRTVDPYFLPNTIPGGMPHPRMPKKGENLEKLDYKNKEGKKVTDPKEKEQIIANITRKIIDQIKAYKQHKINLTHKDPAKDSKDWQAVQINILDEIQARVYLSDEQRQELRVFYYQGKLYKIDPKTLSIKPYSTKEDQAKGKKGQAGFVISANGELFIFSHISHDFNGFNLDPQNNLNFKYLDQNKVEGELFFHSSMTAGTPVLSAGLLSTDDNGRIIAIENSSGHYKPKFTNFWYMLEFLQERGLDLSATKISYFDGNTTHTFNGINAFKQAGPALAVLSGSPGLLNHLQQNLATILRNSTHLGPEIIEYIARLLKAIQPIYQASMQKWPAVSEAFLNNLEPHINTLVNKFKIDYTINPDDSDLLDTYLYYLHYFNIFIETWSKQDIELIQKQTVYLNSKGFEKSCEYLTKMLNKLDDNRKTDFNQLPIYLDIIRQRTLFGSLNNQQKELLKSGDCQQAYYKLYTKFNGGKFDEKLFSEITTLSEKTSGLLHRLEQCKFPIEEMNTLAEFSKKNDIKRLEDLKNKIGNLEQHKKLVALIQNLQKQVREKMGDIHQLQNKKYRQNLKQPSFEKKISQPVDFPKTTNETNSNSIPAPENGNHPVENTQSSWQKSNGKLNLKDKKVKIQLGVPQLVKS